MQKMISVMKIYFFFSYSFYINLVEEFLVDVFRCFVYLVLFLLVCYCFKICEWSYRGRG